MKIKFLNLILNLNLNLIRIMKSNRIFWAFAVTLIWLFSGCSEGTSDGGDSGNYENKVITHALSDPEELTPINANDSGSRVIHQHVFQSLVNIDFNDYQIIPILVKERPVYSDISGGKLRADMEIRPEAIWDNGESITGHDIDFSIRVLKNPKTDSKALKPYLEDIEEVIVDKDNPKKFSFIYAKPYMIAESALTDLWIIPAYIYDPEGIMKNFTVKQLYQATKDGSLDKNADIIKFAEQYNSSKFQREVVVGSGAYTFTSDDWQVNQRVTLKLKKDWWGHQLAKENHWFEAFPETLVFETINDLTTATVALKGEKIDAMRSIEPKPFVTDLRESKIFTDKFQTATPPFFSYDYMAINKRRDKFSDVRTRKALAHIMNVDQLIESFCYGLGERVASFTHPSISERLNPNVKPYAHDHAKAKELLAVAGWKDTDGNGVLDKEIDGEKVDFTIDLHFNTGNSRREKACLIFNEECRKAGIKVNILPLEWSVLLERAKSNNFDMIVLGWVSSPLESDPKQIWHTDSQSSGGSNYAGFGNAKTDQIIDDLRKEMNDQKRYALYRQLHQEIHDDVPYIFLLAQKERIAINKKFNNASASGIRPGYWDSGFQVSTPMAN